MTLACTNLFSADSAVWNYTNSKATISTSEPNTLVVICQFGGPNIAPATDGGLMWTQFGTTETYGGWTAVSLWWTLAQDVLTDVEIAWGTGSWGSIGIIGITGQNVSSPWDTNASNPASAVGWGVDGATISTSNADDLIFQASYVQSATPAAAPGFTSLFVNQNVHTFIQYAVVSETQDELLITTGASGGSAGSLNMAAAVQAGAAPASTAYPFRRQRSYLGR